MTIIIHFSIYLRVELDTNNVSNIIFAYKSSTINVWNVQLQYKECLLRAFYPIVERDPGQGGRL
jgi:hypothetical protein